MNKSQRFKSLLERGYFPAELPPPFVTSSFARYRKVIGDKWPNRDHPSTIPCSYSLPRIQRKRRNLSIVNPISQYYLAKFISDNWNDISKFIKSSKISLDNCEITDNIASRSILSPNFSGIEEVKVVTSASHFFLLITDISRFYGTIYTHTLPWALHGKLWSKQNKHSATFKKTIGDRLDTLVRKGQDNQTIGIPIGPDTSRVLSEIIAVGIEGEILPKINAPTSSIFRFVDDWFIGFDDKDGAETALQILSKACSEFELEINLEKTKILESKDLVLADWPQEIQSLSENQYLRNSRSEKNQRRAIEHYFTRALRISEEYPESNIMDYALKVARQFKISSKNYKIFEAFLYRSARGYPICIPTVAEILINYRDQGAPISKKLGEKYIADGISKYFPFGYEHEVSWLLFLAKGLHVNVDADLLVDMCLSENSVLALLVLDLENKGLINGSIDKSFWASLMITESLKNKNWLLSYEAEIKGWLPVGKPSHVELHDYFRVLKEKGVSFYDESKNVPTFKRAISNSFRERAAKFQSQALIIKWLENFTYKF